MGRRPAGGGRGMIPTLSPTVLPRARTLTDALLSPAAGTVTGADRRALADRLQDGLPALRPTPERLVVGSFLLRETAGSAGGRPVGGRSPFRWSARTARRTLGLAATRRCLRLTSRTPAEAVARVVDDLAEEGRQGMAGPGSLGRWLATLPAGGVGAVRAEATTWATRLVHAVEWGRIEEAELGPADRWWDCRGVALRGRVDVRVRTGQGPGTNRGTVLFTTATGWPAGTGRAELGLAALVAAVAGDEIPVRLVGWWPECGRAQVLEVDRRLLEGTADAVVAAVSGAVEGG